MKSSKWLSVGLAGILITIAACSSETQKSPAQIQAERNPQTQTQKAGVAGVTSVPQLGVVRSATGVSQVPTEQNVVQNQQIPTVTETRVGADINRMAVADFKALGLTDDQAQEVVKYRQSHGPFKNVNQLARVPQMDTAWLADNSDRLAASLSIS